MARIYKKSDTRKSELLDIAQQLFYKKGYEKTTVEDIITSADVSKGGFYHHFSSKEELLDGLVNRMSDQIVNEISTIFNDPSIGVIEKFRRASSRGRDIKMSNKELLKAYMRVIQSDQNLILRNKLNITTIERITPLYTSLISQGIREGVFDTPSPEFSARMIVVMSLGLQDMFAKLIIQIDEMPESETLISHYIGLFEDATERLLGAPTGSICFINEGDIRAFRKGESS